MAILTVLYKHYSPRGILCNHCSSLQNSVTTSGVVLSGYCSRDTAAVTPILSQGGAPLEVRIIIFGEDDCANQLYFQPCVQGVNGASDISGRPPLLARGISCLGNGGGAQRERSKPKLSRTRSHDPGLGYGALKQFVDKKLHDRS